MNLVVIGLYISAFLFVAIGGLLTMMGMSEYVFIPLFGLALLVIVCGKRIEAGSHRAAWLGVIIMAVYAFSAFFPLGLMGLYGAYRDRKVWSAWE
jgi:hypothetical protein